MKKRLFVTMVVALLAAAATGASGARQATADALTAAGPLGLLGNQAILNGIPPPADNPLLDANGNVVLDATGAPVSDPAEKSIR